MKNIFVIEGQAGAGKTPLIEKIVNNLNNNGIYTVSKAPFTLANQYIIDNELTEEYPLGIYSCWGKSTESALFAEELLIKYIEEGIEDVKEKNGVVVFDRGWLTVCMGLLDSVHIEKEKRIKHWLNTQVPTFFLDTQQHITKGRNTWNPAIPWTNDNIDTDFSHRRNYILNYQNLLGRHEVLAHRIDLDKLASEWSNTMLDHINNK